jgi:hypothetical protein
MAPIICPIIWEKLTQASRKSTINVTHLPDAKQRENDEKLKNANDPCKMRGRAGARQDRQQKRNAKYSSEKEGMETLNEILLCGVAKYFHGVLRALSSYSPDTVYINLNLATTMILRNSVVENDS